MDLHTKPSDSLVLFHHKVLLSHQLAGCQGLESNYLQKLGKHFPWDTSEASGHRIEKKKYVGTGPKWFIFLKARNEEVFKCNNCRHTLLRFSPLKCFSPTATTVVGSEINQKLYTNE